MSEWKSIKTIPLGRKIIVKTVTGIVCLAQVYGMERHIRRGRISCLRRDRKNSGDVAAVAWKESSE